MQRGKQTAQLENTSLTSLEKWIEKGLHWEGGKETRNKTADILLPSKRLQSLYCPEGKTQELLSPTKVQMRPAAWWLLQWRDRPSMLFPRKDTKLVAIAFLLLQPNTTEQFYSITVYRNIQTDGKINLLSISHRNMSALWTPKRHHQERELQK